MYAESKNGPYYGRVLKSTPSRFCRRVPRCLFAAGLLLSLLGCSSGQKSSQNDGARDSDGQSLNDATQISDRASDKNVGDASDCDEKIGTYCKSEGGTRCQTISGDVATNWSVAKEEALKFCSGTARVYVQECGGYGVVTLAGVDAVSYFYYDIATSALLRIDYNSFGSGTVCIAGAAIGPVTCSSDAQPASICSVTDAGVD
jgi:hypothetical protein